MREIQKKNVFLFYFINYIEVKLRINKTRDTENNVRVFLTRKRIYNQSHYIHA